MTWMGAAAMWSVSMAMWSRNALKYPGPFPMVMAVASLMAVIASLVMAMEEMK
jgi:uncharacterized protein (DUF427 family)